MLIKSFFYWFNCLTNINLIINFILNFIDMSHTISPYMKYYESPRASDGDKIHPTPLHSSGIVDTLLKHTLGSPSVCEKHGI